METITNGSGICTWSIPNINGNGVQLSFLRCCQVYSGDIIVFGKMFEEHLLRLEEVFARLEKSGLKTKGSKCKVFQKRFHVFGACVSEKGAEVEQTKMAAEEKMKSTRNLKKKLAALGLVGFYRKFIPCFVNTSEPLYQLLKQEKQASFDKNVRRCTVRVEEATSVSARPRLRKQLQWGHIIHKCILDWHWSSFDSNARSRQNYCMSQQDSKQKSEELFCKKT